MDQWAFSSIRVFQKEVGPWINAAFCTVLVNFLEVRRPFQSF
jgi:hypothetical protein